ncbi:MAG: NAD-dependent epimerase/dehydratase family protein [Chitinophagaceae bacterium]|nr:NAD-dependent epimerase/dehydratase family protein [Chitinophagaceae bacterium]
MKIFITGQQVFPATTALTLANNNLVHILVRNLNSPNLPWHKNIRTFAGDINDCSSIENAMQGWNRRFYHTAALVKIFDKEPAAFYKINVDGTKNLLNVSLKLGVKKFVFTSTCGVLGTSVLHPKSENDPRISSFDNDYEFTKYLAENLVKDYVHKGLFTVIVALSKVYGPGIETHPISVNKVIHNFIQGKLTIIPKPGKLETNYCFIDGAGAYIPPGPKGFGGGRGGRIPPPRRRELAGKIYPGRGKHFVYSTFSAASVRLPILKPG